MLDVGLGRDAVESSVPSQHQPPRHTTASDPIKSWIQEVSLTTDSTAEPSDGIRDTTPSSTPFEMPYGFEDHETARSISDDDTRRLEHVQHQLNEPPSTTMKATHEIRRTTDHESNEAEAEELRLFDRLAFIDGIGTPAWQRMVRFDQLATLEQSMDRLLASFDETFTSASAKTRANRRRFEAALAEMDTDIKAVNAQRESEGSYMHELRHSEIEKNERARSKFDGWPTFYECRKRWGHDDNTLHSQSTSSTQVNISPSYESPPKLLQDCYDSAIQVLFMQERLDDLCTERAEQLVRRNLLVDQDCPLDQSDEDFDAAWDGELSYAQNSLDEPRAALRIAVAACEKSNIEIPEWEPHSYFAPIEGQKTWLTTAEERENAKSAYTAACDQPGNAHSDHDNVHNVETRVAGSSRVYSSGGKPRMVRETRLPSTLNGHEISAIPDAGAAANFIALRYVRSHGLTINYAARKLLQTAVGSAVDILGTVSLPFSFKDETKVHHLTFNVMREAVHDVIIGSPFLKLTKTYTKFKYRLQQMLREVRLPRLRFIGSHQYVRGWVNGTYVDAVPDTGADVPVISMAFANEHGFMVDTDAEHRILLQFADGSTATTMGMVRDMNWSFGTSEVQHHIDVYVLEELQTDLILDNNFLYDTNAFVVHERDFWTADSEILGDSWMVSIIKLVDRVLKGSRPTNSATSPTNPAASSDESWRLEKSRQLNAYSLARKQAQSMPEDQREAFLQPRLAQGKQFLESHPGRSSLSQSSISPTTSSTSTQAGIVAPTVVPTTAKRSSFFRKLRVFK